jgi:hypothetical protein
MNGVPLFVAVVLEERDLLFLLHDIDMTGTGTEHILFGMINKPTLDVAAAHQAF